MTKDQTKKIAEELKAMEKKKREKPKSKYDFPTLVTSTSLPTILVHILLELERIGNTLEKMQVQGVPHYKIP